MTAPERRGRPRCEESRAAILDATLSLLDEGGPKAITVDAIAIRAAVSKATIYRWWPSRGHVVLEALLDRFEREARFVDSGSFADELRAQLQAAVRLLAHTTAGSAVASLIAEGQVDPELQRAFREDFMMRRRVSAKAMLARAEARGELRPGLDPDLVCDLLYAPVYLRLLVGHAKLDSAFVHGVVELALRGLMSEPVKARRRPQARLQRQS